MIRLLTCSATASILTGCGSMAAYSGPTLRFSIGWNGIDAGITLYAKKPVAQTLQEAGQVFDALLPAAGSNGKTPALP